MFVWWLIGHMLIYHPNSRHPINQLKKNNREHNITRILALFLQIVET